jgi:two-component system phosphate regulon response regulator PhoB
VKRRILVADDDADLLQMITLRLRAAGFEVLQACDGAEALRTIRAEAPRLTVLDVMMPEMTGLEVCRAIKGSPHTATIGVVLLSARAEETDRIVGLEMGADDYLPKPFSPRELILRIEGILTRQQSRAVPTTAALQIGGIALNEEEHRIHSDGREVDLTASEFKLLRALMTNRGRVLTRSSLLDTVWGTERAIEARTVDTHLRRLREKLGSTGGQIRTVRGFGYRLEER